MKKFKHKETGEVVEATVRGEVVLFRPHAFALTRSVPTEQFHATYEPLEEGGEDE